MTNVFTKVEITEMAQLNKPENRKHVYIEETFYSYFVIAFYEEGKETPTLMMQVEKVPLSDLLHSSMEEWLRFLKILIGKDEEIIEEAFLSNIQYASQFDESIFGLCTGCWSSACCRRATEYMMGNTAIANCIDSVTAATAQYMATLGTIITASFSDNSSKYTKEAYNAATLNLNAESAKEAVDYMMTRLRSEKPVLIGVHYTNGGKPPNNINRATRHFMVVVGMTVKRGSVSFRFYDPGRGVANQSHATSVDNLLIFDEDNGYVRGSYNSETYTLSEIVKTG